MMRATAASGSSAINIGASTTPETDRLCDIVLSSIYPANDAGWQFSPITAVDAPPGPESGSVRPAGTPPPFQAANPARVGGAIVTFERGARTAWHTHFLGQTLIVTFGCGWASARAAPLRKSALAMSSGFNLARNIGMAPRRLPRNG
jgi:hypothetical protein